MARDDDDRLLDELDTDDGELSPEEKIRRIITKMTAEEFSAWTRRLYRRQARKKGSGK